MLSGDHWSVIPIVPAGQGLGSVVPAHTIALTLRCPLRRCGYAGSIGFYDRLGDCYAQ
jgi:hypothetical protein